MDRKTLERCARHNRTRDGRFARVGIIDGTRSRATHAARRRPPGAPSRTGPARRPRSHRERPDAPPPRDTPASSAQVRGVGRLARLSRASRPPDNRQIRERTFAPRSNVPRRPSRPRSRVRLHVVARANRRRHHRRRRRRHPSDARVRPAPRAGPRVRYAPAKVVELAIDNQSCRRASAPPRPRRRRTRRRRTSSRSRSRTGPRRAPSSTRTCVPRRSRPVPSVV